MSQIQEIADHFLSPRSFQGPRRIGLIGAGDTLPASFLTASLALRCAAEGKRILAIDGEEVEADLGVFLRGKSLPLLENGQEEGPVRTAGIDLLPFCLTPDRLQNLTHSRQERLARQEKEAELLLVSLPGDAALVLWAPVLRSFHAVVLQTTAREADGETCYRILRLLYLSNPFMRIHLVVIPHSDGGAESGTIRGGIEFYDRLAKLVGRVLRQELVGPYLLMLEAGLIHALLDRTLPKQPTPSLTALLERLAHALSTGEPLLERDRFPGFFPSLQATQTSAQASTWEGRDLFDRLESCLPLDVGVGPMGVTLLLDWERRLLIGETVGERLGDALIRGLEALEWVHGHLPLLTRLYGKRIDPTLAPHLVLIAPHFPDGFCRGISRLGLPVVLYRAARGEGGTFLERVTPFPRPSFSLELSPEEKSALKEAIGGRS